MEEVSAFAAYQKLNGAAKKAAKVKSPNVNKQKIGYVQNAAPAEKPNKKKVRKLAIWNGMKETVLLQYSWRKESFLRRIRHTNTRFVFLHVSYLRRLLFELKTRAVCLYHMSMCSIAFTHSYLVYWNWNTQQEKLLNSSNEILIWVLLYNKSRL